MTTYNIATILASAAVALVLSMGCGGADGSPSSVTTGSGGSGGATTSASSTSTAGGLGGSGGQGGGIPCVSDDECVGLNDPLQPCWVGLCVHGTCDRTPLSLGTSCDEHDPAQVCNGLGACREVFEYAGACYVRPDGAFPEPCPTCDDGEPCTVDACINDACVHNALPEGHMCGPWFTCQAGNCCPHPDTLP